MELLEVQGMVARARERARWDLIVRVRELRERMTHLAKHLDEDENYHVNSLGECQSLPHELDRLCAVYMELSDLSEMLKADMTKNGGPDA